ncbi:MAG: hypothetical protein GX081_00430 [Firmicutes bacterium]|nr:hypothetical protein [Bacillota bacterium]
MDILTNLKRIFELYRKHFLLLLIATFLTLLLSGLSLGILAGPLGGGLIILCLKLCQEKQADYKEIFLHFAGFLPTLLIVLLAGLVYLLIWVISGIPVIGWLLHFIITPALAFITGLAVTFALEQKLPALDAVKRSLGVCLTAPQTLYLYSLVIIWLGSLGAFLFFFPVIFTAPIAFIGIALAYQEVEARESKSLTLNLGQKEKRIGLTVLAGLILFGLVLRLTGGYQPSLFGRSVFTRNRPDFGERVAGKILSSITGEKVEVTRDGSSFKVGGVTIGNQLPKGYPRDVPLYPKAEIQSYFGDGNGENSTATFSTKEKPDTIIAFYERELTKQGWTHKTSHFGELTIIHGEKKDRSCSITITKPDQEETTIILTLQQEVAKEEE